MCQRCSTYSMFPKIKASLCSVKKNVPKMHYVLNFLKNQGFAFFYYNKCAHDAVRTQCSQKSRLCSVSFGEEKCAKEAICTLLPEKSRLSSLRLRKCLQEIYATKMEMEHHF